MPSSTRMTRPRLRRTEATVAGRPGSQPPGFLLLDRYRLHRPLGAGGFGTVWMARDERLERDVAVKVLARDRVVGGRFEREARAAARLSHPGIVTLYEAAVDDDAAYLVSELVRGGTLSQLLEAGRLSDRDIVEIGVALCDALAHAHSQGVVHRDVKPSNILLPEQTGPGGQVAKLTDFGVARLIGADTLTRTGDVVGTMAYMAPEQADGREVGAAADLYSLALVLYEALSGVNPIAHGPPAQRARRLGAHLPPLRRQRRDLPGDLGQALDLALRPRVRERGTVEDLRSQLADVLGQVEDRPGLVEPVWRRRVRTGSLDGSFRGPPEAWAEGSLAEGLGGDGGPPGAARLWWPARAAAGLTAGLTVACIMTTVPKATPAGVAGAGALAAVLVGALPRLGWVLSVGTLLGVLSSQGRAGAAVLLGLAAVAPVIVLARHRTSWPLAAISAGLGFISLAGAWPALAGRATRLWERAGLGALGWIWTLTAGPVAGRALYTRLPGSLPTGWKASLTQTAGHVLPRLLTPGLLAPAALWAAAAALVPWIRRRPLAARVVLASGWSGALASGTVTLLRVWHAGVQPPGLAVVLGGLAGWVVVVGPPLVRQRSPVFRSADTAPGLA